jgi:hypothetical protein
LAEGAQIVTVGITVSKRCEGCFSAVPPGRFSVTDGEKFVRAALLHSSTGKRVRVLGVERPECQLMNFICSACSKGEPFRPVGSGSAKISESVWPAGTGLLLAMLFLLRIYDLNIRKFQT